MSKRRLTIYNLSSINILHAILNIFKLYISNSYYVARLRVRMLPYTLLLKFVSAMFYIVQHFRT